MISFNNMRLKCFVFVLISAVFLFSPCLAADQGDDLEHAQRAYAKKDYAASLPYFARFYAKNPHFYGISIQYAYALIQQHQYALALEILHQVVRESPQAKDVKQAKIMMAHLTQDVFEAREVNRLILKKEHLKSRAKELLEIQRLLVLILNEKRELAVRIALFKRDLNYTSEREQGTKMRLYDDFLADIHRHIVAVRDYRTQINRKGMVLENDRIPFMALKNEGNKHVLESILCKGCFIGQDTGDYFVNIYLLDVLLVYAELKLTQVLKATQAQSNLELMERRRKNCSHLATALDAVQDELNILRAISYSFSRSVGEKMVDLTQNHRQHCK